MSAEIVAVLMLLLGAAVLGVARQWGTDRVIQNNGLPRALRDADIIYAEQTFRSRRHKLVARVDRVYRTRNGLQLLELKTRSHRAVYDTDVIELSAQRIAMQDQLGLAVLSEAWVIVQDSVTGDRRAYRVALLPTEEVLAKLVRYRAIRMGRVIDLTPAQSRQQCANCGHRDRCIARFHDRD